MRTARPVLLGTLLFLIPRPSPGAPAGDPLAAEVSRWSQAVKTSTSTDEAWLQFKDGSAPVLQAAEKALAEGRRGFALDRLTKARLFLAGAVFLGEHSGKERKELGAFEALWKRAGKTVAPDLRPASASTLAGVSPAVVRAVAEIAYPQVRGYYFASLEYGRNTTAESGLFYLGLARAQQDLVKLCRSLATPAPGREPPLRALGAELDGLQQELVAAYRPPAAIDRHPEFIAAGGVLKEARELSAAGMRHGALLRYLQAADRVAQLRPDRPKLEPAALEQRLGELETRLGDTSIDHSIGRLLLDQARSGAPEAAAIVAVDLLPRYFAALEPEKPAPPSPPAEVTVTMVRWPYT